MIKKRLTKILSLALVFTLALSTPLTTYATSVGPSAGVEDNAGNSGGGGGSMSTSTSTLAWNSNAQGYRIYIIDKNFIRISPVYDFTYIEPSAGAWEYSTRFDGPDSPTTPYYYDISTLQEWCDSAESVPTPTKLVNGERVGNGLEFKNWFFAGQEGTTIHYGTTGTSGISGISGTTVTSGITDVPRIVSTMFSGDVAQTFYSGIESIECRELYTAIPATLALCEYEYVTAIANLIERRQGIYNNVYASEIGKWVDHNNDGMGDVMIEANDIEANDIEAYSLYRAYQETTEYDDDLKGLALSIITYGEAEFRRLCEIDEITYWIYNNQYYLDSSLLNLNIPLAGGEGETGTCPAANLISKNNTIQVPGYARAGDALLDGASLVVEPITWLNVRTNPTGNWQNPSSYEPYKTYGTYWNLAQKWVGGGGFYNTIMTKLFNNCLATSETVTSQTGRVIQGIESTSQKTVAQSLTYMNQGYGLSMHIYTIHN